MTACQMKMDAAIRGKYHESITSCNDATSANTNAKPLFKLKRFLEVEPRTSTKRGASCFMLEKDKRVKK